MTIEPQQATGVPLLGGVLLSLACAAGVTADIVPAQDAPQPMTPAESLSRIHLPAGFEMSLVASEPQVQDPSGIAIDEWGRLFVCELHGYNIEGHLDVQELNKTGELDRTVRRIRWEFMGGKLAREAERHQYGVVKLLSDQDGDGVMDAAEVWADDLPPCYGLIPARGGIIAVAAPDIVFLADRDRDGRVDHREVLYTGFRVRTIERGINNPRWGVDNWIYVGGGGEGGTITGPHLPQPVQLGTTDFRIKADGSALEPVTGRVGTFGMTLNDVGDRFPSSGGTPVVYALPIPFRYLERNPHVASPSMNHRASSYHRGYRLSEPHPWRVRRQKDPQWVKFYGARETDSHYFSGGCSGEFYGGGSFPTSFQDSLFYCEPSLNIIHRAVVKRDGNGYVARRTAGEIESEFLASTDQWFRPMSLRFGPRGGMFVVDMYREIIEDYSAIPRFLQQQYGLNRGSDRGRIWRLAPAGDDSRRPPRRETPPADLDGVALVQRLSDPEHWWRTTARRLLVERGGAEGEVIERMETMVRRDLSARGVLSALYALEGLNAVGRQSLRLALKSRFFEVRVQALRLAESWLHDPGIRAQVTALVGDPDPRVRLQLALTLGEFSDREGGNALYHLIEQSLDDRWMDAAILSSASRWAEDWVMKLLETEASEGNRGALLRPLIATVTAEGRAEALEAIVDRLVRSGMGRQSNGLRGVLDGLSNEDGNQVGTPRLCLRIEALIESRHPLVRELAARIAVQLDQINPSVLEKAFSSAIQMSTDRAQAESDRLHALRLLASAPADAVAPVMARLLVPAESPAIQAGALAAAESLGGSRPAAVVLSAWRGLSPLLRSQVLRYLFSRDDRLPALLDALESGQVPMTTLNGQQRSRLKSIQDPGFQSRLKELLTVEEGASGGPAMSRFQAALGQESNFDRGKTVFQEACASCHRVKDVGMDVGPSLASVVARPDEALLLDLLRPNDKVDPAYRQYQVTTRAGETFSGILSADSATSVTLRAAQGLEQTVLREDIEALMGSELSLMPDNFGDLLSPDDVAHLLAFLRMSFAQGAAIDDP